MNADEDVEGKQIVVVSIVETLSSDITESMSLNMITQIYYSLRCS